jgi:hypothetical protein
MERIMPSDERDRQFERALQRHLRGDAAAAPCPDAEALAAFHERTLSLEEMTRLKEHIVGCMRCQETLALVEETNAVALHEWEEKNVKARMGTLAESGNLAGAPRATPAQGNAWLDAVAASAQIAARSEKQLASNAKWRWIASAGALAAGLLIFVAIEEHRARLDVAQKGVQVAQNSPSGPPDERSAPQQKGGDDLSPYLQNQTKTEHEAVQKKEPSLARSVPGVSPPPSSTTPENVAIVPGHEMDELDSQAKSEMQLRTGTRNAPARPDAARAKSASGFAARVQGQATPPAPEMAVPNAQPAAKAQADKRAAPQAASETVEVSAANAPGSPETTAATNESSPETMTTAALNGRNSALLEVASLAPGNIAAPGGKVFWRVGSAGKIEKSKDGAKNWTAQNGGVSADLIAGAAPSKNVCWIVGKAGTVLLTVDGGTHWKRVTAPVSDDLTGVHADDALNATIWAAQTRTSFATADGGVTWSTTAQQ